MTAPTPASDDDVLELYWQQSAGWPALWPLDCASAPRFVWVAADDAATLQEVWAPRAVASGACPDRSGPAAPAASANSTQTWFDDVAGVLLARGAFAAPRDAAAGHVAAVIGPANVDFARYVQAMSRMTVTPQPPAARAVTASFVPHADLDAAATLAGARRESWVLGRAAMHGALRAHGVACAAIGRSVTGAPALPRNVVGSLSHKPKVAWAGCVRLPTIPIAAVANDARAAAPVPPAAAPVPPTVAPRSAAFSLGVDVELVRAVTPRFATRILCEPEQAWLATLPTHARDLASIVHFAGKEAVYKALHPWLQRYVGFREVGLQWRDAAMAVVTLPADAAGLRCSVQWRLGWTSSAAYVLAWACVYGECCERDGVAPAGSVAGSNTTHDCGPRCQR